MDNYIIEPSCAYCLHSGSGHVAEKTPHCDMCDEYEYFELETEDGFLRDRIINLLKSDPEVQRIIRRVANG